MQKVEAALYRYQHFFGLMCIGALLSVALVFSGGRLIAPAYAASTDVKGSPNIAIGRFFARDSADSTYVKIVYADGHVGDPSNTGVISSGTMTVSYPVSTGGVPAVPISFGYSGAGTGTLEALHAIDPNNGKAYVIYGNSTYPAGSQWYTSWSPDDYGAGFKQPGVTDPLPPMP